MLWCLLLTIAQPLTEPGETGAWDRARDEARLAREFVHNALSTADDGGPCIDWSFAVRETSFADIFCRREIATPFAALRIRMKNLGAPLAVAIKVADATGAEWTVTPRDLPTGDWTDLDFGLRDLAVASWSRDADGRLDFPLRYVTLIAFGLRPGATYQLRFTGPEVVLPEPIDARLQADGLPASVDSGALLELTVRVTPVRGLPDDGVSGTGANLALVGENGIIASAPVQWESEPTSWAPGREARGMVSLQTSRWRAGGRCRVVLRLPGVHDSRRAEAAGGSVLGEIDVSTHEPGELVVKLEQRNGAPTIIANGEPLAGMAYAAYGPSSEVFADFAAAGVRLYSIMGTPTAHGYGLSVDTWLAPGEYDYSQLDARIRMVLEERPDALIFPRLYLAAPRWWLEAHPDAVALYDPGDGKPVPFELNGKPVPSWSSPAWREAAQDALRRLIAHCQGQPYADHILGYHIASCCTEEWMYWGANEDQWTDYSPDNTAAFRRWLRAKYGTDEALAAAWRREVTFQSATVPTRAERENSAMGVLRDPATDRPSIDYYHYLGGMVAETIDLLCGTVREATRGERLVGVFYGYLLQLFGQRQQNAGHLGFDAVVRSPNVDFLCSPTSYAFRAIGTGTTHVMAPLGSVIAHGKLWFDENDIRTSLSPGELGGWGKPADIAGDILQQDRELAMVLTQGLAQWWFDVGANRYNDPVLMERLKHLAQVGRRTMDLDRSPVEQVALVVDGRGLANQNVGDPLSGELVLQQLPPLARIGAPVQHFELHDVDRLERHRMILFSPLYEPTADQLAAIDRLKSDGRVLVFSYAPAPYRASELLPEQMAAVTGLNLRLEHRDQPLHLTFAGDSPLVAGLVGQQFGTARTVRPAVNCDDPAAVVLATLADGSPGLVLRDFGDWTSVWCAGGPLPTTLLARLADRAGVHRYADPPAIIWASRDLLAINVADGGPRTIHLPRESAVTDLYAGTQVSARTTEFTTDIPPGGTQLFAITTP